MVAATDVPAVMMHYGLLLSTPLKPANDGDITMLYDQPRKLLNPATQRFLFATGIECSYPTVEWKGQRIRQVLRYGPPYFRYGTAT